MKNTQGFVPNKDIVVKNSGTSWATTTIMVWVHGNEMAGPLVLENIIAEIEIVSWKVNFIFANLKALEQNKRFCDVNMNRHFLPNNDGDTYEQKRVWEILPYLDESDYLLDCHNTTNATSSIPMIITESPNFGSYIDTPITITGFNDIQPWASDGYMAYQNKVWICFESGNLTDAQWPIRVKNAILNSLKATQNIVWEPEIYKNTQYHFDTNYITQTNDFQLVKEFWDFEAVKTWQLLGIDWNIPVYARYDWVLLFSHNRDQVWSEGFCMGASK